MNEHVKIGQPVEIGEAGAHLPELVAAALRGEDVIISEAGAPQVRIARYGRTRSKTSLPSAGR